MLRLIKFYYDVSTLQDQLVRKEADLKKTSELLKQVQDELALLKITQKSSNTEQHIPETPEKKAISPTVIQSSFFKPRVEIPEEPAEKSTLSPVSSPRTMYPDSPPYYNYGFD